MPTKTEREIPLEQYAAIGDGRTVALIAIDGAIEWLCVPDIDSDAVFDALLDCSNGGRFELRPTAPYHADRAYVPGTNILRTTFTTELGAVTVTDLMTVPDAGLSPQRELVRLVEADSGTVQMYWNFNPRFGFGRRETRFGWRGDIPIATQRSEAVALQTWRRGTGGNTNEGPAGPQLEGVFELSAGERVVFALSVASGEPLVMPQLEDIETRIKSTADMWSSWTDSRRWPTHWNDAVTRSALALKLLVFAPTGAIAAAATTSLPETIGGGRNWDYRFCWVRDSAFVLNSLLLLGCSAEADSFFWWLMHASQLTHPELSVLYRLDGGQSDSEVEVDLPGYRESSPVRIGNAASGQTQLDIYGDLFHAVWLYGEHGGTIDADIGKRLGEIADLVCRIWQEPDAGLWEVRSEVRHFTQSKMMCAIALDRAVSLADSHSIPDKHMERWRNEASEIRQFIDDNCWSESLGSYVRFPDTEELDASLLLGVLFRYSEPHDERMLGTVQAVADNLADGPFVDRYSGEDGLEGREGAFLACSFWLVEALALQDRTAEAKSLMDQLVVLANDVGLFSEEIDRDTGEFLGNLPQGLTHLALISAAFSLSERMS